MSRKTVRRLICLLLLTALWLPGAEVVPVAGQRPELTDDLVWGQPGPADLTIVRKGFALGYSRRYRQALWVSYVLYASDLAGKRLPRGTAFQADPAILEHPVKPKEYTRTGFDRGHLAPAADMAYCEPAMRHSFYMSNISPQRPGCNRGIWKRLETKTRQWAKQEGCLCIITGPLFDRSGATMGVSDIPVPFGFYKVILDLTPPLKMIAFVIPNSTTKKRLPSFVTTVDEVERLTGCDFFSRLPDAVEDDLESHSNFLAW